MSNKRIFGVLVATEPLEQTKAPLRLLQARLLTFVDFTQREKDYTEKNCQGYFAYDSKKQSGVTMSHLRFGDSPIKSEYEISNADYVACHHAPYISSFDVLGNIRGEKQLALL
jgi:hypothetical protein